MSTIARAVLTSGSCHDDVHALGRALAELGYESSVSRGENPFGLVDESVLAAVASYRRDHQAPEEADIPGVPAEQRNRWIGPELYKALLDDQLHAQPTHPADEAW